MAFSPEQPITMKRAALGRGCRPPARVIGQRPAATPRDVHAAGLAQFLPAPFLPECGRLPPPRGRAMGGDGCRGIKGRLARGWIACTRAVVNPQLSPAGGRPAGARVRRSRALR